MIHANDIVPKQDEPDINELEKTSAMTTTLSHQPHSHENQKKKNLYIPYSVDSAKFPHIALKYKLKN